MTTLNHTPGYSSFIPFNGQPSGGTAPLGFDLGDIVRDITKEAVKVLPGVVLALLTTNPTLSAQFKSQSTSPQFISVGIKLFNDTPNLDPMGLNFGKLLKGIADQALSMVPGMLIGLLSANPAVKQQLRVQGVSAQSLINIGIDTPFGSGTFGVLDALPGVSAQGFDLDQLIDIVTGEAKRAIPTIVNGLLGQIFPQTTTLPTFR